jgi:hypothetical protein
MDLERIEMPRSVPAERTYFSDRYHASVFAKPSSNVVRGS